MKKDMFQLGVLLMGIIMFVIILAIFALGLLGLYSATLDAPTIERIFDALISIVFIPFSIVMGVEDIKLIRNISDNLYK